MDTAESGSMNKVTEVETEIRPVVSKKELAELDEGFALALETEGTSLDPQKEKKLVRKFDFYILPMMCMLMSCQLMDKSTASYASIMGLLPDLDMDTNKYAWVGSSFYLGYLFFLYPAGMLLQRFPLGKTLACAVIAWSIIICCHAATHSASTFLLCRTLLGIFESFMDPAYMLMTSQYYKAEEQYVRCAYWLGFQGIGIMLGSGIAYGFYTHEGSYSYTAWRLMYIVTGVITIFFGLISLVHVPDIPTKAWFLTEEEKFTRLKESVRIGRVLVAKLLNFTS